MDQRPFVDEHPCCWRNKLPFRTASDAPERGLTGVRYLEHGQDHTNHETNARLSPDGLVEGVCRAMTLLAATQKDPCGQRVGSARFREDQQFADGEVGMASQAFVNAHEPKAPGGAPPSEQTERCPSDSRSGSRVVPDVLFPSTAPASHQ